MVAALGLTLTVAYGLGAAAVPAATLAEAVDEAAAHLTERLFARDLSGTVAWVNGPAEVVVKLDGDGVTADQELLVRRGARGGFARTVAILRVADVRARLARCLVVAGRDALKTGDRVTGPARVTVYVAADFSGDDPAQARRLRKIGDRLEQVLVADKRVRVVRGRPAAAASKAVEYGTVVVPQITTAAGKSILLLGQRSLFTGQTISTAARAEIPLAVSLTASALPGRRGAAVVQHGRRPVAAYGQGIRRAQSVSPTAAEMQRGGRLIPVALPLESIALGNVDGDGAPELVGITAKQLVVYRWDGRRLHAIYTGEALPRFTTYLHVDTGDLNRNGRAEIVVTKIRSIESTSGPDNELVSMVYELDGGKLSALGRPLVGRFARVLKRPHAPPVLLSQALGRNRPFRGPVTVLQWRSGRYVETRNASVPRVASLYGFIWSDINGDRRADIVRVGTKGGVTVWDDRGIGLDSGLNAGPAATKLGFSQMAAFPNYDGLSRGADPELLAEWRSIPRRLLVVQGPAAPEVITAANGSSFFSSGVLGSFFGGAGHAVGFAWDESRGKLAVRWRTDPLDVPARDVAVGDLLGDGRTDLVLLAGSGKRRTLRVMVLYAERA